MGERRLHRSTRIWRRISPPPPASVARLSARCCSYGAWRLRPGVFSGGSLTDKLGARRVIVPALSVLALAFASLSASALWPTPAQALVPVLGAIVIWGFTAWTFMPAQQTRLIAIGGVAAAPVVLSLNASFMYAGFSLGAVFGSLTLNAASHTGLGVVGAAFELLAVGLVLATGRRAAVVPAVAAY